MSDIIKNADWDNLKIIIEEENKKVSGMTPTEVVSKLKQTQHIGDFYTYNATTANGYNNVTTYPDSNATEAMSSFIAGGGTIAATGAAIGATGATTSAGNVAILESVGGTASVGGLLSVTLPNALACLAPLAGVSIGVGLYESNPDLWDKLSQAMLPWAYPDTGLIGVITDAVGNTYYNLKLANAVKNAIGELEKGVTSTLLSDTGFIVPLPYTVTGEYMYGITSTGDKLVIAVPTIHFSSFKRQACFIWGAGVQSIWVNDVEKTELTESYTYNNKTVYYYTIHTRRYPDSYVSVSPYYPKTYTNDEWDALGSLILDKIAWTIMYGDLTKGIGLSSWDGNEYPENPDTIKVLSGFDADGNPTYEEYISVGNSVLTPGVTRNPFLYPDPTTNTDEEKDGAISPWVGPFPLPTDYPDNVDISKPVGLDTPVPLEQEVALENVIADEVVTDVALDPTVPTEGKDSGSGSKALVPTIPILPSSATGLIHVYNPTYSQINQFGTWLWETFSGDLIETLSKLFNDPMDAIIGLHELYATPAISGTATIRAGYLDSGVSSNFVGNRYTEINCGSVIVEEYYQNYLDYSPYTQAFIYLPFIGIVPVSADDIIGNAVNITYHVDSYTGCCIAVITVARDGYSTIAYQFEGNCASEIPISSGYQSALVGGLLTVAGTAISGSPMIGMAVGSLGRAGLGKNSVQHSGSFGHTFGAMGAKIPYIIIKRPVQKRVQDYSLSYGYPAHKLVYVGNCTGYLRCREVRVMSTTATNEEKDIIVDALKSGVYVK